MSGKPVLDLPSLARMGLFLAMAGLIFLDAPRVRAQEVRAPLVLQAQGEQDYVCTGDAKGDPVLATWHLEGPQAILTNTGATVVVVHSPGPRWMASDMSAVEGSVLQTLPSPDPNAIAWLVLRGRDHSGLGTMQDVTYITRTDTVDGKPDAAACTPEHLGDKASPHYRATYTFYYAGSMQPTVDFHVTDVSALWG